jgi:hypothetical protein
LQLWNHTSHLVCAFSEDRAAWVKRSHQRARVSRDLQEGRSSGKGLFLFRCGLPSDVFSQALGLLAQRATSVFCIASGLPIGRILRAVTRGSNFQVSICFRACYVFGELAVCCLVAPTVPGPASPLPAPMPPSSNAALSPQPTLNSGMPSPNLGPGPSSGVAPSRADSRTC